MEIQSVAAEELRLPTRRRKTRYRMIASFKDFSLVCPALLFLGVFTYYPLLFSVYISFTDWNLVKPAKKFVGLLNYEKLLTDPKLYHVLKITFVYTILDVVLTLAIGLLLALLLNVNSRVYNTMRLFIFMPHYISMVIASMVFVWILNNQYGIMNKSLSLFGMEPVHWLDSTSNAIWGLIMVSLWKGVGFTMIIFLAGLRGIPVEYYEASSIDGANKWQQFLHVTLPLLSPTTLFLLITSFISSMQVFQSVDVMTDGGPLESTKVMVYWIYQMAFRDFRAGRSSALVILFFFIIIALTIVQFVLSRKKVHYEG
ncbi:glycerol-3-phosphate ABC transporter permease [Paenibacillus sp. J31TS4]|uniref:carbohydrate ABC transporter permease n=1 Tax=Paenibacillus sp. J31TS4 TaxID=2807195 RepID=UPI001AFEACFC|nr:sugar ABC transporter permease [Paenibacillus sp. J31TS4]GIP41397.1 glycerol-3-phosphate ABC transporter permease [Paenibacillus sp. J31TS4]